MASKVIFCILAAFLATSVLADNPSMNVLSLKTIIHEASDQLIEFVEQVLLGVNKLISVAIHEVAYGIQSLFFALEKFRDFGIQLSEDTVDAEMNILNALIEKYRNETSKESQIILQCIEDIENEAVQIRDQGINSSLFCIDSAIQHVGDSTMQILLDIKNLNEDLKKEEQTLETCKNETSPSDCVKGVFDKLVEIAVTLATTIAEDGDKAQADYDNLGVAIEKCANDTAAVVQKENEKVINDFSECVSTQISTTFSQ